MCRHNVRSVEASVSCVEGCSIPFACFGELSGGSRGFSERIGAKLEFSKKAENLGFGLRGPNPQGKVRTFSVQSGIPSFRVWTLEGEYADVGRPFGVWTLKGRSRLWQSGQSDKSCNFSFRRDLWRYCYNIGFNTFLLSPSYLESENRERVVSSLFFSWIFFLQLVSNPYFSSSSSSPPLELAPRTWKKAKS